MYANEEMCRCYGKAPGQLCRMCLSWKREYCERTNRKKKCPSWGTACGKFKINEDAEFR